jgi:hypothetical protein
VPAQPGVAVPRNKLSACEEPRRKLNYATSALPALSVAKFFRVVEFHLE